MVDSLKLYAPELRDLLGGETPLAAELCQAAFGADRLERSPEEIERLFRYLPGRLRDEATAMLRAEPAPRDESSWQRVMERVLDAVGGDLIKGDPDQLIGGVAAAGHVGSYAHRLSNALREAYWNYCVVSVSRLVFARQGSGGAFEEVASVPRNAVLRARRAGRLLQRGRVVLDFVDLSQLALMAGAISARPANRLVSAINGEIGQP